MSDSTPARIPTLKIKLSLSSKALSTPSHTSPKGKGRAILPVDTPTPTPSISLRIPSTVPNGTISQPSEAGSSTIRLVAPISKPTPITPYNPAITSIASPSSGSVKKRPTKYKLSARKQPSKASLVSRPSAIPPRLLSTAPSTPKTSVPLSLPLSPDVKVEEAVSPGEDGAWGIGGELGTTGEGISTLKAELDEGELAKEENVASPSQFGMDTTQPDIGATPVTERGRPVVKWARLKKPLRELCGKIMIELRRKDEYAYFDEPVDMREYPDYAAIVGGEEKMMDLGTMQNKIDDNTYRSMDEFESDLRKLVTAAQAFNLPTTKPYTTAARILDVGLRNINRLRPTVRTPSPSPVRRVRTSASDSSTPFRGQSTFSALARDQDPDAFNDRKPVDEIPPEYYIPDQMLSFPPNSLAAMAVGWNLNGGRRQYARRLIRGREKFTGKWRHWNLDGSRDLGEMEDPEEVLRDTKSELRTKKVVDWNLTRAQSVKGPGYWEFELGGPNGQAPIPFTSYPRPFQLPTRGLGYFDFGVYPQVESEEAFIRSRLPSTTHSALYNIWGEQLRPTKPRPKVPAGGAKIPPNFINVFDAERESGEWLRDVCLGGVEGEAYLRSMDSFLSGAIEGRSDDSEEESRRDVEGALTEHVHKTWRNGVLSRGPRKQVASTVASLEDLHQAITSQAVLSLQQEELVKLVKNTHDRLRLRDLTSTDNPLSIKSLLKDAEDFLWMGHTKGNVTEGLRLVGNEIARLNDELLGVRVDVKGEGASERVERESQAEESLKKPKYEDTVGEGDMEGGGRGEGMDAEVKVEEADDSVLLPTKRKRSARLSMSSGKKPKVEVLPSAVSSPLSQPPDSPKAPFAVPGFGGEQEEALRALRLELIALSKFYPLAALQKMTTADADRLLPQNVRGLMTFPVAEGGVQGGGVAR